MPLWVDFQLAQLLTRVLSVLLRSMKYYVISLMCPSVRCVCTVTRYGNSRHVLRSGGVRVHGLVVLVPISPAFNPGDSESISDRSNDFDWPGVDLMQPYLADMGSHILVGRVLSCPRRRGGLAGFVGHFGQFVGGMHGPGCVAHGLVGAVGLAHSAAPCVAARAFHRLPARFAPPGIAPPRTVHVVALALLGDAAAASLFSLGLVPTWLCASSRAWPVDLQLPCSPLSGMLGSAASSCAWPTCLMVPSSVQLLDG
ncbi:hypothetical protein BU15DRAFT_62790 [Melanogaster broomeanus]|nr:hypothetical protein BU15DRAFT_62790 [Melanogaster broomeanus]